MKTLHLTNAWHPASGGISTFYRALLQACESRGHQMRLVVPGPASAVEEHGDCGRIYHIAAPPAPMNPAYRMISPLRYLLPNGELIRILRDEQPDLVEISEKYSLHYLAGMLRDGWIAGLKLRPTVVGLSCERMDENASVYLGASAGTSRFARIYMKWLYFAMFDHHITVSDHTAGELHQAARGHKVRRGVWVESMGVDSKLFSAARRCPEMRGALAEEAGGSRESTLLLYAGRLVKEKNLGLLIEVMERLSVVGMGDYRLLIAGEGDIRSTFEESARARVSNRICFLGHIGSREALADLYANADVFVHPKPREPFGIAPLEAMASGLPLVAPNSGGIKVYANQSNAWLAAPDAESFAAQIQQIPRDGELRGRKLAAAKFTAHEYDWDSIAGRFLRLYRELHELRLGTVKKPSIEPAFYSTLGSYWGREIKNPG